MVNWLFSNFKHVIMLWDGVIGGMIKKRVDMNGTMRSEQAENP
jgi:hypothetical protein